MALLLSESLTGKTWVVIAYVPCVIGRVRWCDGLSIPMGNFAPPLSSLPKAPKSSPPGGVLPEKTVKSQIWSPLYVFLSWQKQGKGQGGPGTSPNFQVNE